MQASAYRPYRPEIGLFEIRAGEPAQTFVVGRKNGEQTYRIDGQLVTVREYLEAIAKATAMPTMLMQTV